ncbi:MAG: STAS domain-containing protein [Moraxellaceae bacterium]|jgi:anti-anti-sigma factor|nr:STAS domain-containing protein [Moraxellaceae bacterium]HQV79357.1 STAS domain-containing protein [Agitococcus sp.]MBK8326622.1 STAS domain-containing protein [Moraxellaceae bacterium]MBK9185908.1 STAS domain-containing protein [Moraxellaceae bacterium]MBL0229600.1 STAS domain-containing protein [Moraxellaceae bacterium]
MAVLTASSADGSELIIKIKGRFDFSTHQEFRNAYEQAPQEVSCYVVDLKDATYLDSSALGMLLLLRDHAGGDSSQVKIVNCNADVKKILSISNFEQLFTIV